MSKLPTKQKIRDDLAANFSKTLGITLEQAYEMLPEDRIKDPQPKLATDEEKILEAQAVLTYYMVRGKGFFIETCRSCKSKFAYSYNFTGVKYCSIECIHQALQEIGLSWTMGRPLDERYGRYAPAVVPSVAFSLVDFPAESQTVEPGNTPDVLDLDDFLKDLNV
jgi:hypothetical protein